MKGGYMVGGVFVNLLGEKQEKVLRVIDRFGVITSTQLIEYLKGEISHVTVYNTKKKLVSLGFITEEKIGYQLILAVRPSGVEYLGSRLTPFTKINFGQLKHQLLMNECIIALNKLAEKKGKDFTFLTERELRSEYLDQNFSKVDRKNPTKLKLVADRIPDFVVMEGEEMIAHEVELTQKSSKRYQEKLARYRDEILNGRYKLVRYLCEDEKIRETIVEHAKKVGIGPQMLQLELVGRLLKVGEKQ
jgi:hypothetical protein